MLRLLSKPVGGFKSSHGPTLWAAGTAVISVLIAVTASGCLAGGGEEETESAGSPAGENSIVGPDENGNGIRDDVNEYISRKYDGEKEQAVRQFAKAMTKKLVRAERGNEAAVLEAAREGSRAPSSAYTSRSKTSRPPAKPSSEILNTYERSEVAEKASGFVGGHAFDSAGRDEEVCK